MGFVREEPEKEVFEPCLRWRGAGDFRALGEIAQAGAAVRLAFEIHDRQRPFPTRQIGSWHACCPDFAGNFGDEIRRRAAADETTGFHDGILHGDVFHIGDDVRRDQHDTPLGKF